MKILHFLPHYFVGPTGVILIRYTHIFIFISLIDNLSNVTHIFIFIVLIDNLSHDMFISYANVILGVGNHVDLHGVELIWGGSVIDRATPSSTYYSLLVEALPPHTEACQRSS